MRLDLKSLKRCALPTTGIQVDGFWSRASDYGACDKGPNKVGTTVIMPLILCITVLASVSFGILAAYAVVFAILSTFGRPSQPEAVRPRLVLVPTQNHASGD
jgi:hypothetical protein